jgi:hypothetical protein
MAIYPMVTSLSGNPVTVCGIHWIKSQRHNERLAGSGGRNSISEANRRRTPYEERAS